MVSETLHCSAGYTCNTYTQSYVKGINSAYIHGSLLNDISILKY